jgi:tetratricopeptide (TPR) repeat protein
MEEEGASSWTAQEAELRQRLEQSLRENPADRAGMISLGTLLATKGEFGEAKDLLQRGSIGMANDPSAFELLRKLGIAHVALWKAMRIDPESASSINTSDARKTHLAESAALFDQAASYPENRDLPAAILEAAMTKMHRGQLREALDDFSGVVAHFPAMPRLNAVIFRAACLLKHLGDLEQACQYLEYVSEDPPTSIGYGRLEVLALWADCLVDRGDAFKGKATRVFRLMAEAWARAQPKNAMAPAGIDFKDWGAPWLLLADRVLRRCDYVVSVEFLQGLLAREPTPLGYQLLAEAQYVLGNKVRALDAMAQAFRGDPNSKAVQRQLMAWDAKSWAPLLDKAAAEKLFAEEAARKEEERRAQADAWGEQLQEHHLRQRRRDVLAHWHHLFTVHFAATTIARVVRGHAGRVVHRGLVKAKEDMEYRIRRQVRRINKHLLKDVMRAWHTYWFGVSTHRRDVATPMIRRADRRLLTAVVLAWRARARRQVIGRAAAKKAMRGLGKYVAGGGGGGGGGGSGSGGSGGTGKLAKKAQEALVPVFYSKPLTALARFPLVRVKHEEAVAQIVEAKVLEKELLAEAANFPAIDGDGNGKKSKKKKKKKKKEGDASVTAG